MFANRNETRAVGQVIRWTARGLSILSTAIILLFFIGERFEISRVAQREWVGLILFPIGVISGFAVAWWKEGLGGSITIASLLAFYLVYGLLINGRLNQGWAFFVFAFPGLLFLISFFLSRSDAPSALHPRVSR